MSSSYGPESYRLVFRNKGSDRWMSVRVMVCTEYLQYYAQQYVPSDEQMQLKLHFDINSVEILRKSVSKLTTWIQSQAPLRRLLQLAAHAEIIRRQTAGMNTSPAGNLAFMAEVSEIDQRFVDYYLASLYLNAAYRIHCVNQHVERSLPESLGVCSGFLTPCFAVK